MFRASRCLLKSATRGKAEEESGGGDCRVAARGQQGYQAKSPQTEVDVAGAVPDLARLEEPSDVQHFACLLFELKTSSLDWCLPFPFP